MNIHQGICYHMCDRYFFTCFAYTHPCNNDVGTKWHVCCCDKWWLIICHQLTIFEQNFQSIALLSTGWPLRKAVLLNRWGISIALPWQERNKAPITYLFSQCIAEYLLFSWFLIPYISFFIFNGNFDRCVRNLQLYIF